MFNTIKSKIIAIITGLLILLWIIFAVFAYLYYHDTKKIMLDFASKNIAVSAQEINKEVIKIEKNAKDLAMMGELYYKFEKDKSVAEQTIIQLFKNYPESLGGGIWFKEYQVHPDKRLDAIYAFRNLNNQIVLDPQFETEAYNYPEQKWYKEILPGIVKDDDNIEWSSPYFEKEGSDTLMITAGSVMFDDNGNIIGISTVDWAIGSVIKSIRKIKPTANSFSLFANPEKDYIIVSTDNYLDNPNLTGKSLKNIPWYNENLIKITYFDYHGKKFIPYVKKLDNGMVLIVCVPKWELFRNIFISVIILCIILGFLGIAVASLLYAGLRTNILTPIGKLISIANKISEGDNNIEIKIENPEEFAKLASTYDKMTKDIKNITTERARINSELQIAKTIQQSSLPEVFPPFPERNDFDIFASMIAAKEVSGDFYDFYFLDENRFMFLIADVSGKGVPASLFMMNAKTLINNLAQTIQNPKELITEINKRLCVNNKYGLFITLLAGIIDLKTGKMSFINCGHNPPLIKQANGIFEYLKLPSNIVLGVIDYAEYEIYETQLSKGDIIFAYTDGVTEALNSKEEMFGEERLLSALNLHQDSTVEDIEHSIKKDVEEFTGAIPQSDDMTMLVFKYNGASTDNKKFFNDIANEQNYKNFYEWLHKTCEEWSLDGELVNTLDMCAEEIYANVRFYAYNGDNGPITAEISNRTDEISLKFTDKGIAYNPLERPDPDVTLPPEKRPLGGLGIYMVKQMTKDISYERINDENILTLVFNKK